MLYGATTFSTTTLSMMGLIVTVRISNNHLNVMLSVVFFMVILNVIMLSAIGLHHPQDGITNLKYKL
jgi:hypothetical protein